MWEGFLREGWPASSLADINIYKKNVNKIYAKLFFDRKNYF